MFFSWSQKSQSNYVTEMGFHNIISSRMNLYGFLLLVYFLCFFYIIVQKKWKEWFFKMSPFVLRGNQLQRAVWDDIFNYLFISS